MADEAIAALVRLHAEVDARAHDLRRRHADRLQCRRGCSACCIDDLSVFEVEADLIRAAASTVLDEPPHPVGACAFLDAHGACRIYAQRPYVCRTQGLPLRWVAFDDPDAGTERRDICPLNETEDALETLPSEACWELGPTEGRLAGIQATRDGSTLRRVALRSLFAASR